MHVGIKVATHICTNGSVCTPSTIIREVEPEEIQAMRGILSSYIPKLNGKLLKTSTCMYTMTEDEHFLIDFHPKDSDIVLVSPCSGHGFKVCT